MVVFASKGGSVCGPSTAVETKGQRKLAFVTPGGGSFDGKLLA
jgi:hypothetical protein